MTDPGGNSSSDWDALPERRLEPPVPDAAGDGPPEPQTVTLMAASWGDLVGMLTVCTGALLAVLLLGQRPALPAFGWAAVLGLTWWAAAALASVVVRQGTPGMLLAGVRFADPVAPHRLPWVLAAALVGALTLGATGLLGGLRSPLAAAASSAIVTGEAL